jgi:hypothetical protein
LASGCLVGVGWKHLAPFFWRNLFANELNFILI